MFFSELWVNFLAKDLLDKTLAILSLCGAVPLVRAGLRILNGLVKKKREEQLDHLYTIFEYVITSTDSSKGKVQRLTAGLQKFLLKSVLSSQKYDTLRRSIEQNDLQRILKEVSAFSNNSMGRYAFNRKIILLYIGGMCAFINDPKRAEQFFSEALSIAPDDVVLLNTLGVIKLRIGYPQDALKLFKQVLEVERKGRGRAKIFGAVHGNLGVVYKKQGKEDLALDSYRGAFKYFNEINDKIGMAKQLANMGIILKNKGEYELAKEKIRESIKFFALEKEKKSVAKQLNNLALTYKGLGRIEKAKRLLLRSNELSEKVEYLEGQALAQGNLFQLYVSEERYEEAIFSGKKVLKLFRELGDREYQANTYNYLGDVSLGKNKYVEALEFFQKSLKLYQELNYPRGIAVSLFNLVNGNLKNGSTDRVSEYITEFLTVVHEEGYADLLEQLKGLEGIQSHLDEEVG